MTCFGKEQRNEYGEYGEADGEAEKGNTDGIIHDTDSFLRVYGIGTMRISR